MTRNDLRFHFTLETDINYVNKRGEPEIDYVTWLEDKLLEIEQLLLK
jgi:hypothetical protein